MLSQLRIGTLKFIFYPISHRRAEELRRTKFGGEENVQKIIERIQPRCAGRRLLLQLFLGCALTQVHNGLWSVSVVSFVSVRIFSSSLYSRSFAFPSVALSLSHSDSESAGTAAAVTDSSAPSKVMRDGDQVYDIWVVKVEGERERGREEGSSWKRK